MNTYRDNFDPVELNKKLTEDGYALLKNVLDKEHCNKLIQLCEENYQKFKQLYAKNKNKNHGLNDNVKEKLVYNLYNKSDEFLRLIDLDPVYEICKSQLNRGAFDVDEPITLRQMTARCPLEGQSAQKLHIDSRHLGGKFPFLLVAIIALDPFTEGNGATRLVPQSHLNDAFPIDDAAAKTKVMEMSSGDILIFNGNLWHGGGACKTNERRWGLLLTYTRWFYKPAFQHHVSLSNEFIGSLNRKQKELLGLSSIPPIDEFDRLEAIKDIV